MLHTLNIRLFPEQLTYIANHAEDEVIFVDRTVLPLLWKLIDTMTTVKHVVVMDDGGDNEIPDDPRILDYETLLADAEPVDFHVDGRELRRLDVLHERHHRQPEGRRLLAPLDGPAHDGGRSPRTPSAWASGTSRCRSSRCSTPTPGASRRPPRPPARRWSLPGAMMQPEALAKLIVEEGVTFTAGVPTIWQGVLPHLAGRRTSCATSAAAARRCRRR